MEDFKVTFNFNLLVKKATDEMCAVRLIVRWGKPVKEVKVSTGIKAAKAMWDSKSQRLFTSDEKFTVRANRDAKKTNKQLDEIADSITSMFKQSTSNDRIYADTDAMKNEITARLNNLHSKQQREEDRQKQGATDWMLKYIDSDRIDPHTMRYVAERTKIHQRTVVHRFQAFLADCQLADKFETFTSKDFERLYTNWAYKAKNYKQNTVIASFGVLKPLLNAAKKDGIEIDNSYYKELQGKGKDVDNIYLTEEEIKKIYNLDIPSLKASGDIDAKSNIEATRDLFIIGCWTGLRRSDINKLNDGVWSVKDGEDLLYVTAEKTKRQVVIPLHPTVKAIYQKYNGILPKLGDKANTNNHLRNLGRLAGIDEIVPVTENRGGKVTTYHYKKYELIGMHTARRSFATNMYLRGMPTIAIMQLTGHTTESNFLKYIKVTAEQNAMMIAKMMKKFNW